MIFNGYIEKLQDEIPSFLTGIAFRDFAEKFLHFKNLYGQERRKITLELHNND